MTSIDRSPLLDSGATVWSLLSGEMLGSQHVCVCIYIYIYNYIYFKQLIMPNVSSVLAVGSVRSVLGALVLKREIVLHTKRSQSRNRLVEPSFCFLCLLSSTSREATTQILLLLMQYVSSIYSQQ